MKTKGYLLKLSEKQEKEIVKIMTEMEMDCPKHFSCCGPSPTDLCKANYVISTHMVECIEMTNQPCKFKSLLGEGGLCKCPLRCFLAKELGI